MAIKFLQNIDLGQNQLLNARIHVAGSEPSGKGEGSVWLDSGNNTLKFYVADADGAGNAGWLSVLDDTNDNSTTFTLTADSGTNQTIGHGNTLDIAGGASITTSVGNTDTVTIDVTDNTIGAAELSVSGNGGTTQFLRSDGDGTFSWAVPTDTNTNTQNIFTTSFVDSSSDVIIRMTKSGAAAGTQDLKFVAGDNITLSPDGTNMTITGTDTNTQLSNAQVRAATAGATDSQVFTDADHTKLNSIESSATADQSNAEIRAAVAAATDSQVFTDADHTKLDGVDVSADVTTAATVRTALNNAMASNTLTIGDGNTTTTFPGNMTVTGTQTVNNVVTVSTSNGIQFEGSAADGHDAILKSAVAGSDKIYTLPNATGTVALTSDITGSNSNTNTGDQLVFKTIAVAGQSSVVADTTTDTLTLTGAGATTITTAAGTDTITITSANDNTQLTTEAVQDIIGGMLVGTETRVAVGYDDTNGRINFVVDDMTANDNTVTTAGAGITLAGTAVSVTQFAGALAAATTNVTKSSNTYTLTHGLGNVRVNVIITTVETPFEQVFPEIQYTNAAGNGSVKVIFGQSVNDAHYNFTVTR